MRLLSAIPAALAALLAAGCSSSKPSLTMDVAPGSYPAAFAAVRESLVEKHFELDRVDARAGIITTRAKTTAGLATPWDPEQSTTVQEFEDLANQQQRRVRVSFQPINPNIPASRVVTGPDMLDYKGPMVARFDVTIERIQRPGWRPSPRAISLSSFSRDPGLVERGMQPAYSVPFADDPELAKRLVDDARTRMKASR